MRSLDRPDSHAGTSSSDAGTAAGKRTRTEVLQRRSAGGAPAGDTAASGAPAAGGSNALPGALQAQMNAAFDFDFSSVQVHQGPEAARLGAEAFTAGTDVHFAPGRYQPDSAAGQSLIGHELAHVVQQSEGRVAATTQFRGRAGNDDDGLEAEADRWGDAAAAGQVIDRVSGVHAPAAGATVQRKLTVTGEREGTFDGENDLERFKQFVAQAEKGLDDPTFASAWTLGKLRHYLPKVKAGEHTVAWSDLADDAATSRKLATAVGGEGLPLFDNPEAVNFGEVEGTGAKGYVGKMVRGLEGLLPTIKHAKVSIAQIEGMGIEDTSGFEPIAPVDKPSEDRRPGLTILNYAKVFLDTKTGTLVIAEARGHSLCDQFALALRAYASQNGCEYAVERVDAPETELLTGNYGRLAEFFKAEDEFKKTQTLSFGYASAFTKDERFVEVATKSAAGWVGTLFQVGEDRFVAVLDSDVKSSYHGEILAKNVKLLLESGHCPALVTILAGGSAGSLLPSEGEKDKHLPPGTIYTPDLILGPDGKPVPNALKGLGQTSIEGSVHTSVVSALVETPNVLQTLHEGGIQTIDMEFGYVAAVVNRHNESSESKVSFGIACLITDYPRTAGGTDLHEKNSEQKTKSKQAFVETVHAAATK
jgi:hypothetical protein